jgi:hypothetical protein
MQKIGNTDSNFYGLLGARFEHRKGQNFPVTLHADPDSNPASSKTEISGWGTGISSSRYEYV